MKIRKFGNSALQTSVMGLGALHFGVFCDQEQTTRIVRTAADNGVSFFDTAPMYGNGSSEEFLGKALTGIRDHVVLSTKGGLLPVRRKDGSFGVKEAKLTSTYVRESVEASLRALGTDRIDLYQLHAYDSRTPIEETLGEMDKLVREGKVRYVGCSNYDQKELSVVLAHCRDNPTGSSLTALQCHYNMLECRAQEELLPVCREHRLGVICNRALARGVLTGKYKRGEPLPEGSRAEASLRVRAGLVDETLDLVASLWEFAVRHRRSIVELAIAWLARQEAVTVVLVGVRNLDQLAGCIGGTDWELDESDVSEIARIIADHGLAQQVKTMPRKFLEK